LLLLVASAISINGQEPKLAQDVPNLNIHESYDRFSDLTSVSLSIQISGGVQDLGGGSIYAGNPARSLSLAVIGIFEGTDISKAVPKVAIVVSSRSREWVYLKSPTLLQVIIDGKTRATLGEMVRVTSEVEPRGRGVTEQVRLMLPFGVIAELSNATKLEMRVGPDEFDLKKEQLQDLREWVRRFPAAKSPYNTHQK